jgi:cytochrome c553
MFKMGLLTAGILITVGCSQPSMAAGDVAAGKSKAATCVGCHGVDGVSMIPNYPNLNGQKAAYTAKQLRAFRDKTRKDPVMSAMAANLTDKDIEDLAAYYASLK